MEVSRPLLEIEGSARPAGVRLPAAPDRNRFLAVVGVVSHAMRPD